MGLFPTYIRDDVMSGSEGLCDIAIFFVGSGYLTGLVLSSFPSSSSSLESSSLEFFLRKDIARSYQNLPTSSDDTIRLGLRQRY